MQQLLKPIFMSHEHPPKVGGEILHGLGLQGNYWDERVHDLFGMIVHILRSPAYGL